ncbi:MAG: hypothetical protein OXG68_06660, partial [Chloroflexi bacterium]|nr:hypothetical protein [Chloroflexota bacterium]
MFTYDQHIRANVTIELKQQKDPHTSQPRYQRSPSLACWMPAIEMAGKGPGDGVEKKGPPTMPNNYKLDQKIEALNLLDQHDDDFHLVKKQLDIPVKTLRGWRANQEELRRRFDDRQFRYFANIKQELLKDMLESSRDIMKQIKSGDHQGVAISQLAYTLTTLLSDAKKLEENHVHVF